MDYVITDGNARVEQLDFSLCNKQVIDPLI